MMEYRITDERRDYLEARGFTILTACPGSGKTTSITYKMKKVAEECLKNYGGHSGIICLSFTNSAVEEIHKYYYKLHGECLGYPHKIMTIDSFYSQYILMPFWYLLPQLKKRPMIVDDTSNINIYEVSYMKNGKKETAITSSLQTFRDLFYKKNPRDISLGKNGYLYKNHIIENEREKEYAKAVIQLRLETGIIGSLEMEYLSALILKKHPYIGKSLAKKFPYIIIDESQDASELQHYIFDLLKDYGVDNIEYVGDLYQSIYEWRNAKPILLYNKIQSGVWNIKHFSENRRSNQRIINLYSLIRKPEDPPIISLDVPEKNIDIIIYRYDEGNEAILLKDFENTCISNKLVDCHVLVRGKEKLRSLSGNESKIECWKTKIPYLIIDAYDSYKSHKINIAFEKIRKLSARLVCGDNNYSQIKEYITSIKNDNAFNSKISYFFEHLPSFSLSVESWQIRTQELLAELLNLANPIDFSLKAKIKGYQMNIVRQMPVKNLFIPKAYNKESLLKFNTIHDAKGASYDAVLLFLNKPHINSLSVNLFSNDRELDERHRLIYVACSRAKHFLALAIPNTVIDDTIKAYLKVDYVIKKIEA